MLGTPPAFILSQDRTLWKMFIHGHSLSYWLISVLCPVSILTVLVRLVSTKLCKEFSRSNVFHCSVINVPCGLAPASAATLIGYQTQKPLSTTFLFYYQSFLFSAPLFCGAEDILALTDPFGKHYFIIFFIFQLIILYLSGRRPTLLFQRRPSIGRQTNIMLRQSIPCRTAHAAVP